MENKNYTTKANIEAYLGETISNDITTYIISAQSYIDKYTNRDFKVGTAGTVRYYDGNGTRDLIIDPAIAITKVEISTDEGLTFTQETNYIKQPINELPIIKITLRDNFFPNSIMSVKITGTFGWSASVPEDITYCATLLASIMYKGNSPKNITSESIGDYSISYDADGSKEASIKSILDKYKKLF